MPFALSILCITCANVLGRKINLLFPGRPAIFTPPEKSRVGKILLNCKFRNIFGMKKETVYLIEFYGRDMKLESKFYHFEHLQRTYA